MRPLLRFLSSRLGIVGSVVFVIAGFTAATTPLSANFFEGAPYGQAAVVTSIAILLAALTHKRLPAALDLLVGLIGGVAVLSVVLADVPALFGAPGDPNPLQIWRDIATGWSSILAAAVPIEASAQLLALPLALCWAGAYLTVLLVAASRSTILSLMPLTIVTVIMLLLGPGSLSLPAAAIIAASMLGHVAARAARAGLVTGDEAADSSEGPSGARPMWQYALRSFAMVGVPAALLAASAGVGLGFLTGGAPDRTDLHRPASVSVRDELTPLARVRSQLLDNDDREMFTVRLDDPSALEPFELDRVRIATLERYDGALWTSDGHFLPVVRRVRQPDQTARPTVDIQAEVRMAEAYESSYLPIAGLLREAEAPVLQLGLNEGSDTLVADLTPGSLAEFRFAAAIPTSSRPDQPSEGPPSEVTGTRELNEELPVSFEEFAGEATGDEEDPIARLDLLEAAMTDVGLFGYSAEQAYSGHSLPILDAYLAREPSSDFGIARQGYAEHGAAAFALLARAEGFDTRVVVGYLIEDQDALLAGEPVSVTANDAHAWVEVFLGDEWAAFDPTNREERPAQELPDIGLDESGELNDETDGPTPLPPPRLESEATTVPWRLIVSVVAAGVLLVAPPVIKAIRRIRRRRRGEPADRVLGAWKELRDRLRDRGVVISQSTTPRDLESGQRSGWMPAEETELERFSELIDRALYDPAGPEPGETIEAWSLLPPVLRELRGSPTWVRRLVAPFDPRSLRRPPQGRPPAPSDESLETAETDLEIDLRDGDTDRVDEEPGLDAEIEESTLEQVGG